MDVPADVQVSFVPRLTGTPARSRTDRGPSSETPARRRSATGVRRARASPAGSAEFAIQVRICPWRASGGGGGWTTLYLSVHSSVLNTGLSRQNSIHKTDFCWLSNLFCWSNVTELQVQYLHQRLDSARLCHAVQTDTQTDRQIFFWQK